MWKYFRMAKPTPQTLQVWEQFLRTHRAVTTVLDRELRSCGLTLDEYDVMVQIERGKGDATMSELATAVLIGRGSLTRLVDHLVETGLVERRRDNIDRRIIRVSLTATGRRRFGRAARVHLNGIATLIEGPLCPEQVTALGITLASLSAAATSDVNASTP